MACRTVRKARCRSRQEDRGADIRKERRGKGTGNEAGKDQR